MNLHQQKINENQLVVLQDCNLLWYKIVINCDK